MKEDLYTARDRDVTHSVKHVIVLSIISLALIALLSAAIPTCHRTVQKDADAKHQSDQAPARDAAKNSADGVDCAPQAVLLNVPIRSHGVLLLLRK